MWILWIYNYIDICKCTLNSLYLRFCSDCDFESANRQGTSGKGTESYLIHHHTSHIYTSIYTYICICLTSYVPMDPNADF